MQDVMPLSKLNVLSEYFLWWSIPSATVCHLFLAVCLCVVVMFICVVILLSKVPYGHTCRFKASHTVHRLCHSNLNRDSSVLQLILQKIFIANKWLSSSTSLRNGNLQCSLFISLWQTWFLVIVLQSLFGLLRAVALWWHTHLRKSVLSTLLSQQWDTSAC